MKPYLVGGFNPFEKYESNGIISPNRGENKKNIWNHHLAYYYGKDQVVSTPSSHFEMMPFQS